MEGGRQGTGQQGGTKNGSWCPHETLPKFSGEKTESADNHLDAFDNYLEIKKIVLLMQCSTNHKQIWLFLTWKSQKVV